MSTQPERVWSWRDARRILAVRLDNLGDVLLATPAIRAIRRSLPDAEITLLASSIGAQIGWLNPDIDDVIVYNSPAHDPWQRLQHSSAREQFIIRLLKEGSFDGAVIFTSFRQSPLPSAYLCYLADIPLRLAASIDGCGSLLTTRHNHPPKIMHEVERGLDLVGAIDMKIDCDDLVLQVPDEARQESKRLRKRIAGNRMLVVLHPGCSMPARTYPWEQYADVVSQLIEDLDATVALTGVEEETELVRRIRRRVRAQNIYHAVPLAGRLSFPEFCGLIAEADLVVTNNTGPMHIAAAMKTPVIALFALTNPPQQWCPWRVPHRLLFRDVACKLCYARVCPHAHECLHGVSPTEVVDAAVELLGSLSIRMKEQ